MLEKISLLEETIMELKIEKCEMSSKIKTLQNIRQQVIEESEQEDTPEPSMQIKTTADIIELICEEQLE